MLRQWRQLGRTKVLTIPRIDNKYALYGAVSYAVGLATDNAAAKRSGIRSYQRVINAMRRDGSNPLDSGRGGSAIHYTVLGISSLVATAELSLIDGVDLYGYSGRNGDLNQAISFLISATRDPSIIAGYAAKNESGFSEYSPENQDRRWVSKDLAAWITVYERRFPDSPVTEQLLALTSRAPLRSALVSDHIGGNALCWIGGR